MIQSVERAIALLNAVASEREGLGVRELARRTGLKPSTAQQLLKTLQARGMLLFDEDLRRYRLGLAFMRLAQTADPVLALRGVCRPFIDELHASLGETVTALTFISGVVVLFEGRETDRVLAVKGSRGVVEHPHIWASGRLLLAHQPPDEQRRYAEAEPLAELGPNLPKTPETLLAVLRQTAQADFVEARDAGGSGVVALSVPVFDAAGSIMVALGCSVPLVRFTPAFKRLALRELKDAARQISTLLGR
jgi:DNA-binding IclR family transcriptional regulator